MKLDFGRKKNLVFYSGGQDPRNHSIHRALAALVQGSAKSITYIPYTHENGLTYFNRFKKRYKKFGFKKFRYFAVDADFAKREMTEALKSDVVYLAGGNTFYFLKHLRQSGFLQKLNRYSNAGGVVAGLSAGAIIMTPHIHLAGYPIHVGDLNEVRLKNLKSLGLVDFEFLPHYINSAKTNRAMLRYSKNNARPIYAVPDGSGLVVSGESIQLIGVVYVFFQGKKIKLSAKK